MIYDASGGIKSHQSGLQTCKACTSKHQFILYKSVTQQIHFQKLLPQPHFVVSKNKLSVRSVQIERYRYASVSSQRCPRGYHQQHLFWPE
jgi:hypothetical protein